MNKISVETLLERYSQGKRIFDSVHISYDETLKDVDLSDVQLLNSDIRCDFENVKLMRANFSNSGLGPSHFKDVDLTEACLFNVDVEKCKFSRVKFTQADMRKFGFHSSKMFSCDLTGADLRELKTYYSIIEDSDLTEENLENSYINELEINRSCLHKANIKKSVIYYLTYLKVDFKDVRFSDSIVNLEGFRLDYCVFSENSIIVDRVIGVEAGINLSGVDFSKLNLSNFNFESCDLSNSNFKNCELADANFNKCNLNKTNFLDSDFDDCWAEGAVFCETIMPDGTIRNS